MKQTPSHRLAEELSVAAGASSPASVSAGVWPDLSPIHTIRKRPTGRSALCQWVVSLMAVVSSFATIQAQGTGKFTVDWAVVSAGGGVGANPTCTISASLGQTVAGTARGGNFTVAAGFWTFEEPPTAGPRLRLAKMANRLLLAWPSDSRSFILQSTHALRSPPATVWTDIQQPPSKVGGEEQVVVPLEAAPHFFRLRAP